MSLDTPRYWMQVSGHLHPPLGEIYPRDRWIEDRVGPLSGLGAVKNREISCFCRASKNNPNRDIISVFPGRTNENRGKPQSGKPVPKPLRQSAQ
jgi:hypothetical protein